MTLSFSLLLTPVVVLAAMGAVIPASDENTPFPQEYRGWTHIKSEVIMPGHKLAAGILGIHHIYANDAALDGYKTGEWRDGAIIVFDLFSYEEKDNALVEDRRKRVDVMIRSHQHFAETGGWGYASFVYDDGAPQRGSINADQCHACHTRAEGSDSVFSEFRQ